MTEDIDELPEDAPVELTDEQKREAEIAAGKAALEKNKDKPQEVHPSLAHDPDAALKALKQREQEELLAKQEAEMSPAAKANAQIFDRIKSARNQPPPAPPRPPGPPPQAVLDRTAAEMAAGKAAQQKHAQQQLSAVRVQPSENELKLQSRNRPVYQPDVPIKAEIFPESPRLPGVMSTDDRKRKVRSA